MPFAGTHFPAICLPIIYHWLELSNYHCNLSLLASFSTRRNQAIIIFFSGSMILSPFEIYVLFIICFIYNIAPYQGWFCVSLEWAKIKLDFEKLLKFVNTPD